MIILASNKIVPVSSAPFNNGAIAVEGNLIADVGPSAVLRRRHPSAHLVDLGDVTIMPGLINTHTHLELSNLSGIRKNDERDFFKWIMRLIDKRRELGLTGLRSAASTALGNAIATGTTCVGDISGTGLVTGKIKASGIRATIFHELIGMDPGTASGSIEHLQDRLRKYRRLPDRISQGLSPHSVYSVSDTLFRNISELVSSNRLPLCIHAAESFDEISYIKGRGSGIREYLDYTGWAKHKPNSASSPVRLLKEHDLLDGALVVHAVHVNRSDIGLIRKHGASVSHCPRSNHLLGVGKAPVRRMIDSGVNVSLGTDSLASNLDLDMWEEMRFSYLVNDISAGEALRMATVNGAKALGLEGVTGALETGFEADVIAVKSTATRSKDPYPELVCHTRGNDVIMSMVQGRVIYKQTGFRSDGL